MALFCHSCVISICKHCVDIHSGHAIETVSGYFARSLEAMKHVVGEALEFQVQKIDPHRGTEQKQSDLKTQVQICTEEIQKLA